MASSATIDSALMERAQKRPSIHVRHDSGPEGRNVRCMITTDESSPQRVTVRIVGTLEKSAAFVAAQVVQGHLRHGHQLVCLDLTAVTDADPAALHTLTELDVEFEGPHQRTRGASQLG